MITCESPRLATNIYLSVYTTTKQEDPENAISIDEISSYLWTSKKI